MPKVHYAINRGQPLCGQSGDDIYISADLEKVDCKKCLTKLILEPNIDKMIIKPVVLLTGRLCHIDKLAEVVSQTLVENDLVEEAFEMYQMVNKTEYLEEALMVFEQYVTLK